MANRTKRFVVSIANEGCDDLELRKLYMVVDDDEPEQGFLRVIDESGEDYLYPARNFAAVELSEDAIRALRVV